MPPRRPRSAALVAALCLTVTAACGLHSDVKRTLDSAAAAPGAAPGAVDDAGQQPAGPGAPQTVGGGTTAPVGGDVSVPGQVAGPSVTPAAGNQAPAPGAPVTSTGGGTTGTHLFTGKDDTVGISPEKIVFCVHAALTYGSAFHTTPDEFNVHWQEVNSKGGIYGRQVEVTYENDNYSPTTAVEAARACKAKNPFFLLGGIGFDQIPAVRNYVEKVHLPYLHHSATIQGTKGQRYSFSASPTVERVGDGFAAITGLRFHGKK